MSKSEPLLEYIVSTRSKWGTRIFPDGRVEEYTDKETTFDDGDFVTRSVPLEWRPLTHLSEDQMEQLQSSIRAAGFFQMPARLEPDPRLRDGTITTWTISLDGKQHEVTEHAASSAQNPDLKTLSTTLQQMTAEALRAENQSGDEG